MRPLIRFTGPFNLTGQPALSVPAGRTEAGLPIGVQLVGRPFDETRMLQVGAALQAQLRDRAGRLTPAHRLAWRSAAPEMAPIVAQAAVGEMIMAPTQRSG
ncbi:MAG TPA: amidase family protein [Thermomicrobiales bacterium]|nr:amidase family protein [Thermomicrobiales bacterium]